MMHEPNPEAKLKLSDILSKDEYSAYNAFVSNMLYPSGLIFNELIRAVAVGAYNQAIQDKNAKTIPTNIDHAENISTDTTVVPDRDKLVAEALAQVEQNEEESEEND